MKLICPQPFQEPLEIKYTIPVPFMCSTINTGLSETEWRGIPRRYERLGADDPRVRDCKGPFKRYTLASLLNDTVI
ncbi:hypothetical protein TNCV_3333261 [Trichonephila clavipes]|nr:hypothetical protein TNCV_3333261 [Trichonephila clavipes]